MSCSENILKKERKVSGTFFLALKLVFNFTQKRKKEKKLVFNSQEP